MSTSSSPTRPGLRRVAVTGLGVIAHNGLGVDAFWNNLLHGEPGDTPRTITDFDPNPYFDNVKEVRRADRVAQFALAAAAEALNDAGEIGVDPARFGVICATGVGGINTLEEQIEVRLTKGERRVSPFLVPMMMVNAAAAAISMRHGLQGPCQTVGTACAAGTHALGDAARLIQWGYVDAVIAGGSESSLTPTSLAGFGNMTALSRSGWSRPFDANRDGFVIAEAAGLLVLEEWDHAVARGARIYAEFLGSASTADAHHITAPSPGGAGAVRSMELALADAGIRPEQVGHVNAHGTSTALNDAAESEAMCKVFGSPGPIVTSTKGVTGHALGAAGGIEAVALAKTISTGLIPPTRGTERVDDAITQTGTIDLVIGEARTWTPAPAISNSFGFGGHNGTIVMAPPAWR
jgi:3-oxoacyl-[acyl-carrier-protein] synthase II